MKSRILGRRGSILIHVMVTGIVVAFIAATLMRMTLLRQQAAARGAIVLQEKRDDTALLAQILASWNSANGGAGQTCATTGAPVTVAGYTPAGPAGVCGCTYTPTTQTSPPTLPSVTTALVGGSCQLTIVSAIRQ